MAVELVCPRCGSTDVRQVWYNRFKDGLIVPVYPTIDDDIWDCAACGGEFEVDILDLVEPEQVFAVYQYPDGTIRTEPDMRPIFEHFMEALARVGPYTVRADTGGGKTNLMAELIRKI